MFRSAVLFVTFLTLTSAFDLTLLHTNDLHSRFDEITSRGSACRPKDKAAGKCYGGVARLKAAADAVKRQNPGTTVFLNAGDFFQGTVWYSMFKWEIVANLTSSLGYTASSLGNHEFDDGVTDLVSYIDAVSTSYPLLAANLDFEGEPELKNRVKPSLVVTLRGGVKVGVVGFLTPDTKDLASTGEVRFLDEVESLRAETKRLRSKAGVNIFIAVGHSGYEEDIKIANEVEDIDIVVGGHTNTFLWNSTVATKDSPMGPYPTVIRQPATGRKVLVVQTSGYGKYLGQIEVRFNSRGEIVRHSGNPVLLEQSRPEDPWLRRQVDAYGAQVAAKMETKVGVSGVFIDGERPKCRLEECGFGDFVTDAMAAEMGVEAAIINSGAIKGSFRAGDITMEDVMTAMPWSNTVDVVSIPGSAVKAMLEHSASQYDADHPDPSGRFLQVSGFVVTYDMARPPGSRLRQALLGVPESPGEWREVKDEEIYDVACLSFMVSGGDGYKMIPDNLVEHKNTGYLDNDLIVDFIEKNSPLKEPNVGRIRFGEVVTLTTSGADGVTAGLALVVLDALLIACISAMGLIAN